MVRHSSRPCLPFRYKHPTSFRASDRRGGGARWRPSQHRHRLNNLAGFYRSQGRYQEAEPLYHRARAIAEAALGPDHLTTGGRLNNLAYVYETHGRYQKAEALYHRALAIAEAALGPEHPDTGVSLNNLAGLHLIDAVRAAAAEAGAPVEDTPAGLRLRDPWLTAITVTRQGA